MINRCLFSIFLLLMCRSEIVDDRIPSIEDIVDKLDRESDVYFRLGNYKEAESLLKAEDNLIQRNRLQSNRGHRFRKLGIINWNLGNLQEAERCFEKARDFYINSQIFSEELNFCEVTLNILGCYQAGKVERSKGALEKSNIFFQKAILQAETIRSPDLEVKCLRQLSGNYWEQHQFEEYYSICIKAFKLASVIQHRKEIGICCNNIGLYFWKKAFYSKAIFFINEGLNYSERENATENISICLTNLSVLHFEIGDYPSALQYLKRGIEIDRKKNDTASLAIDLNNLGLIYKNIYISSKQTDDLRLSINAFNEALAFAADEVKSNIYNNLGRIYLDAGLIEPALGRFKAGLTSLGRGALTESELLIRNSLGFCYLEKGQLLAAINMFQYVIKASSKYSNPRVLWETFYGMGRCLAQQNKTYLAIEYYEKSIGSIDMIRNEITIDLQKASFNRDKSKVFEEIIYLNYKIYEESKNKINVANIFRYIEKAKAQSFFESYEKYNRLPLFPNNTDSRILFGDTVNKWNPCRDYVIRFRYIVHIIALLFSKEGMDSQYEKEICALTTITTLAVKLNIEIAEYFVMEKMTILLIIDERGCKIHKLPPRKIIRKIVNGYIKFLETPGLPAIIGYYAANRIYIEILKPYLNTGGRGNSELVIIPDDLLCYLPFESLVTGGSPIIPEYLIFQKTIAYMPSASMMKMLQTRSIQDKNVYSLVAFGDPDISEYADRQTTENHEILIGENSTALNKLKYSRKEIRNISKFFSLKDSKIYLSDQASEKNLRLLSGMTASILHIACHSLINDSNPSETGLILSPSLPSAHDGIMKVSEIYNLNFPVEMVVLSSCSTARGTVEKLEGVLGLSRVFFMVGVSSIVSALWAIEDESTAVFMERFYDQIGKGNSLANSLRNAKIEMINSRYSNPRYWAAFVLYGGIGKKIKCHGCPVKRF